MKRFGIGSLVIATVLLSFIPVGFGQSEQERKIPAEAQRAAGQGSYKFKNAQSAKDVILAADQFKVASTLAPWKPEYYFNLALAYEQADQLGNALRSFEDYLLVAPGARDAGKVNAKIGELQAKQDERDSHAWVRLQATDSTFVQSLEGKSWSCGERYDRPLVFTVRQGVLFLAVGDSQPSRQVQIKGKEFPGWGSMISKLNGDACYDRNKRNLCGPNAWFSDDTEVLTMVTLSQPRPEYISGTNIPIAKPMECCREFSCLRDQ
jgi:hypothetical protein